MVEVLRVFLSRDRGFTDICIYIYNIIIFKKLVRYRVFVGTISRTLRFVVVRSLDQSDPMASRNWYDEGYCRMSERGRF